MLTVTMILDDPVYWEEPFIRSASFELDPATRVLPEPCEPQVEIPRARGRGAALSARRQPVPRRVRRSCSTCRWRPRAAAPRRPIPEYGEEAARHLQGAGQVHGVLLRRHDAGGDEQQPGRVPER